MTRVISRFSSLSGCLNSVKTCAPGLPPYVQGLFLSVKVMKTTAVTVCDVARCWFRRNVLRTLAYTATTLSRPYRDDMSQSLRDVRLADGYPCYVFNSS